MLIVSNQGPSGGDINRVSAQPWKWSPSKVKNMRAGIIYVGEGCAVTMMMKLGSWTSLASLQSMEVDWCHLMPHFWELLVGVDRIRVM